MKHRATPRFAWIALVSAVAFSGTAVPSNAADIVANMHTLETPPLAPGQIELLTVSTLPDMVTGGNVLVRVRGLQATDVLNVALNGTPLPVSARRFVGADGTDILIDGLIDGENTLTATATGPGSGARTAALNVRNHPISGPVISGPHQMPFRCRTIDAGLGAPTNATTCAAPSSYQWFAFSKKDLVWRPLANPSSYPDDVATTVLRSEDPALNGKAVPFVARLETAVINRGIARIAVLDDPAARANPADFTPNWNGRAYHAFGQSCGVGYDQGRNNIGAVLGSPTSGSIDTDYALGLVKKVGEGDVVIHSTLTTFGNHCNPFVSAETTMMLKEHVSETYPLRGDLRAPIDTYIGAGNSGGALQQYNLANNTPGVLDAAMASTSFADITTLSMTTSDCVLFQNYFASTTTDWNEAQKAYVTGLNAQTGTSANSICQSWAVGTRGSLSATQKCGGLEPSQQYRPTSNPRGARCTVADANVNWLGADPTTGFARRPLDNVGVQYGLRAFNNGLISFDQFADLNRAMGGFDIDGNPNPARHAMDADVASIVYRVGQVVGRGALAETPIIDFAPYLDLVPVAELNIHDSSRPFINRLRVRQAGGGAETMAIWRGVVLPADGFGEIDQWVRTLNAAPSSGNRIADVAAAKPLTAFDQCAVGTFGGRVEAPSAIHGPLAIPITVAPGTPAPDARAHLRVFVPEDHEAGLGPCSVLLPPVTTTRMAAGGPAADDVIKCQVKAVDPADYNLLITPAQIAELGTIFPGGVCDWSKPSVGDVGKSIIWPSLGGATPYLDEDGNAAPIGLVWRVARS